MLSRCKLRIPFSKFDLEYKTKERYKLRILFWWIQGAKQHWNTEEKSMGFENTCRIEARPVSLGISTWWNHTLWCFKVAMFAKGLTTRQSSIAIFKGTLSISNISWSSSSHVFLCYFPFEVYAGHVLWKQWERDGTKSYSKSIQTCRQY